ncbi:hypothetical protein E1A91_A10G220900v1 [Gossypium mustelinum]|uniref:Uncharacterized protein n=1 Tax=Gossypium mustelinum TaxID=34275 RepID=A0A5D2XSS0_GOSMU|nr:hypothetical protein E1A91_A10G220900v1 [Gossypium mustelinum]
MDLPRNFVSFLETGVPIGANGLVLSGDSLFSKKATAECLLESRISPTLVCSSTSCNAAEDQLLLPETTRHC